MSQRARETATILLHTAVIPYSDEWIERVLSEYPPLLTKQEYAALVRQHERTVQREIAAGRIPVIRTSESGSGRVLIAREVAAMALRRMRGVAA